jgi:hypothetical protein
MTNVTDPVELARVLADIASSTSDNGTAIRLLELVNELLKAAGLGNDPGNHASPSDKM